MTATTHGGSSPHMTTLEGTLAALTRLEALIRRAIAAIEPAMDTAADDPFRGLHLDAGSITRMLAEPPGSARFGPSIGTTDHLPDGTPAGSRLAQLGARFDLSPLDVDLLIVALGPDIDVRYERFYAYLQDDVTRRRPSVNLALDLLCGSAREKLEARARFDETSPLRANRLIEWIVDPHHLSPSLLSSSFRADDQIVRFVIGAHGLDRRLNRAARLIEPTLSLSESALDPTVISQLSALVGRTTQRGEPLRLAFHGRDVGAQMAAAEAVAGSARRKLLIVDMSVETDTASLLPIAMREADLQNAVLLLERWDAGGHIGDPTWDSSIPVEIAAHAEIIIFSGERPWVPGPRGPKGVVACHFGVPAFATRRTCWAAGLALTGAADHEGVADALGARFRLTADQIWDAVLTARRVAQSRSATSGSDSIPTPQDFFGAARLQTGHELATAAARILPVATWDDIVLPDDAVAQLRELCDRVAHAPRVLEQWGFDRRLSYGKGVTALFSGPSGTGKTMAAEVVANELGLDLYRIEIPAVVSKWIGETEKNLDRIFRVSGNAILFFDEADALFGKRSDVREAHDRYANIEISYLLQRMETFEGVAILATNVRHHLDEAFLRRLTFVVQFPFPDDEQRERIWRGIWPAETPIAADLDFARLARRFTFAGGNVKNVAMAAAFTAAARGRPVGMADVVHGVRREYQKLGKNLGERELSMDVSIAVAAGAV